MISMRSVNEKFAAERHFVNRRLAGVALLGGLTLGGLVRDSAAGDQGDDNAVTVFTQIDVNRMLEQAHTKFGGKPEDFAALRTLAGRGELALLHPGLAEMFLDKYHKDSTSITKVINMLHRYSSTIHNMAELKDIFNRKFEHINFILVPVQTGFKKQGVQIMLRETFLDSPEIEEVIFYDVSPATGNRPTGAPSKPRHQQRPPSRGANAPSDAVESQGTAITSGDVCSTEPTERTGRMTSSVSNRDATKGSSLSTTIQVEQPIPVMKPPFMKGGRELDFDLLCDKTF